MDAVEIIRKNQREKFKEIEFYLLPQIMLFGAKRPHIMYFINKYLNEHRILTEDNKEEILATLVEIFQSNRLADFYVSKVHYHLLNQKKLLKEYFATIHGLDLNDRELRFVAKVVPIEEIRKILTIKTEKISFDNLLFSPINAFCRQLKEEKRTRPECQNCELFRQPMVILDTNLKNFSPVDVVFIGLNPGKDEVKKDRPFVGTAGKRLREAISKYFAEKKYLITNIILCHTKNSTEIRDISQTVANCNYFLKKILFYFPSKHYVLLGNEAKDAFSIGGKISEISGKVFRIDDKFFYPVVHPSSVRSKDKERLFFDSMASVKEHIETSETTNDHFIGDKSEVTDNEYTLLDICILDESVIYIYIDENGKKKYYIDNNPQIEFHVKTGHWTELNPITNFVDHSTRVRLRYFKFLQNNIRGKDAS